mmetsp:Transcript_33030/g.76091  ORF Transcript_33030/g.76091 Transcript_33030/m.76091 type:complete len:202 (-) Transcript_33030:392-997(-)
MYISPIICSHQSSRSFASSFFAAFKLLPCSLESSIVVSWSLPLARRLSNLGPLRTSFAAAWTCLSVFMDRSMSILSGRYLAKIPCAISSLISDPYLTKSLWTSWMILALRFSSSFVAPLYPLFVKACCKLPSGPLYNASSLISPCRCCSFTNVWKSLYVSSSTSKLLVRSCVRLHCAAKSEMRPDRRSVTSRADADGASTL